MKTDTMNWTDKANELVARHIADAKFYIAAGEEKTEVIARMRKNSCLSDKMFQKVIYGLN